MADVAGKGSPSADRVSRRLEARQLEARGLEARTKAVEEAMAPLIEQVTELSGSGGGGHGLPRTRSGKPPKLRKLVQLVEKATMNFVAVGEQIASENSDFQEDLLLACDEVKSMGESMHQAALEFSYDTLDEDRRETMVTASRSLLMAVTRLMVAVDAVDIQNMFRTSSRMEMKLQGLFSVSSEEELMKSIRDCTPDITRLTQLAAHRLNEERSEASQQLLAAAQTQLNQASRSLITSSKVFLQYPKLASAQANRHYVISSMVEALGAIADLADGENPANIHFLATDKEQSMLHQHFDEFESLLDWSVNLESSEYPAHQNELKRVLESLLAEAGNLLSLPSTHDYRQHSIITLSSTLKRKIQKLFGAFVALGSRGEEEDGDEGGGGEGDGGKRGRTKLDKAVVVGERVKEVEKTAKDLQKELCHAVMDQLSGVFLQPLGHVERVEAVAMAGNETALRERAASFTTHATEMEKAAHLVCSLSRDEYGVRTVQFVTKYISSLKPQVVYAAQSLCAHPHSNMAQRNMVLFREAWVENVQLLQDSVEALVSLIDFMSVDEIHIREDSQKFVQAMESGDDREMRRTLQSVQGRSLQLLRMVQEDMQGNSGAYSRPQLPRVEGSLQALQKSLAWFCDLGFKAADTLLSTHDPHSINKGALEEAAQKVNEDIWDLRRAVLVARGEWEGDIDSELQTPGFMSPLALSQESTLSVGGAISPVAKFERTPRFSGVFQHSDNTGEVLAGLSSGQRAQLAREAETLSQEHRRFESEVQRWSDSGHDIIIIAKEMCSMMVDMSDFTRGLGQLKTAMDLIVTAKDVARAGEYLYFVTRPIAEKCPDPQHRGDLLAHLDRMRLHTHQLKITSSVKAELGGEASAGDTVDSASAMVNAARSLMSSVVLVVKTCYIASTAIARAEGTVPEEVVQWRLESPKKKQLTPEPGELREETLDDIDTPYTYREKKRSDVSPSTQLLEFRAERQRGGNTSRGAGAAAAVGGRGSGRWKGDRGGRADLEAIPEVSSTNTLQGTIGTYF